MFQYNSQPHQHIGRPLIQSIFPEMRTEAPAKSFSKNDSDLEQRLTKLEILLSKDVIDKLQSFEERLQQMSTNHSKVQNTTIQSTDTLISQLQQEQNVLIQKVSQLEAFMGNMIKPSPNTSLSPSTYHVRHIKPISQSNRASQPVQDQGRMSQRITEALGDRRHSSMKAQVRNSSNDQKQADFAQELQSLRYQIQDCLTLTLNPNEKEKLTTDNGESLRQSKSFGPEINPRQSLGNLLIAQSRQEVNFSTQRGVLKKVASNSSIEVKQITSSAQPSKSTLLSSGKSKSKEQNLNKPKAEITPVTQLKHSLVQSASQKLPLASTTIKEQTILSEVSPIAKLRNNHISGFSFINDITNGTNVHESVPIDKIIDRLERQDILEEFSLKP